MPILNIYIDDNTEKRLKKFAEETQRTVDDLAECAVAESALDIFRHRGDDPARDTF